jgi:23S rRNA (pseudouridine1915-N3)-methyltransferase
MEKNMNIKVVTLDKISEKFTQEAVKEYDKRLSRYCKILLKECKSETQLLKEINERAYIIHIKYDGDNLSSENLSQKLSDLALEGKSDIVFLISSKEISETLISKVNYSLAISKMDIGFNVLIVILYEQIYRAFRIQKSEPYHK